jgi:hypothetical protein
MVRVSGPGGGTIRLGYSKPREHRPVLTRRGRPGDWGRSGLFRDRLGRYHPYRSLCERRRMQALDAAGLEFRVEAIRLTYHFEGRPRTYVTDLVVFWWENGRQVIRVEEVKPRVRWKDPQNLAKWRAAKAWCDGRGYQFLVVDESTLLKAHPAPSVGV